MCSCDVVCMCRACAGKYEHDHETLQSFGKSRVSLLRTRYYDAAFSTQVSSASNPRIQEIAALKNALPGEGDPNAAGVAQSKDKMLSVQKNDENRSLKTNRLFPTPNKPDPMPQNLAFLFTKLPGRCWKQFHMMMLSFANK